MYSTHLHDDYDAVVPVLAAVVELTERAHGAQDPRSAAARAAHATALLSCGGDAAEIVEQLRGDRQLLRQSAGAADPDTRDAGAALAAALCATGGEKGAARVAEELTRTDASMALLQAARARRSAGDAAGAAALLRSAVAAATADGDGSFAALIQVLLASALRQAGDAAGSAREARAARDQLRSLSSADSEEHTLLAQVVVARCTPPPGGRSEWAEAYRIAMEHGWWTEGKTPRF
eukprot:gene4995-5458_t